MTASSFNAAPGLPILHSTDLVNWDLINYALPQQVPAERFAVPQHGNGVWAPNIRYHKGRFWIFYPDPDAGIYVTHTDDPAGNWSQPELILPGKGIIDPTPLWDDDGKAYLLHAWAKSRAGFNNVLSLREMDPQTLSVSEQYTHIIDGNAIPGYRTLEGPKFYKRNGYYYVFAPAGGVELGWQSVFRSKDINGPYEARVVMEQGDTYTNGPHQGSWVHTEKNEDWFIHFQSAKAYGRIVHLQPLRWHNDWPVIGEDTDGDGIGQPVARFNKPKTDQSGATDYLQVSDEFNGDKALVWQWNANYQDSWYSLTDNPGYIRLLAQPSEQNLWYTPALMLQKLPAPQFELRTKVLLNGQTEQSRAGLILFGEDYAWIGVQQNQVVMRHCKNARIGCEESTVESAPLIGDTLELRMVMQRNGNAIFSYRSEDMPRFRILGEHFQARKGRWVGAKVGLFMVDAQTRKNTFMDIDYFRFRQL